MLREDEERQGLILKQIDESMGHIKEAIASGKKIPESQDGLVFWCIQPED